MGTDVQRRLFNVDEYYRLAEAGILGPDDRVELIDGAIVEMSPIGSPHAACVDRLDRLLQRRLHVEGIVRVQGPIRLSEFSEPQPDLSVLRQRPDSYTAAHPAPADVLLVVEVADSSLKYDRDTKVGLYARAGIPEVWLVDLADQRIEVFTRPAPEGYLATTPARRGERIRSDALPGANILADDILGPDSR